MVVIEAVAVAVAVVVAVVMVVVVVVVAAFVVFVVAVMAVVVVAGQAVRKHLGNEMLGPSQRPHSMVLPWHFSPSLPLSLYHNSCCSFLPTHSRVVGGNNITLTINYVIATVQKTTGVTVRWGVIVVW